MKKHFISAFLMPVKLLATHSRPWKERDSPRSDVSMGALIQVLNIFYFDFINSKNSAVTKLGTCNVNVLCHLEIKYYIAQVFIF